MYTSSDNYQLLLIVTFCGFFNAFIPLIVKFVLHMLLFDTKMEISLRRQVCDLKAELGAINMCNEFAKYAKIQRKINKASDELKNQNNLQTMLRIKARIFLYAILYAISALVMSYMVWNYRYEVLVRLPDNLFYPFGFLLAFPTGVKGALAITPWTAITTFIGRKIVKFISP